MRGYGIEGDAKLLGGERLLGAVVHADDDLLHPGEVLFSTQGTGDIHRISVASKEKSISLHVYGCRFDAVNREYYADISEEH